MRCGGSCGGKSKVLDHYKFQNHCGKVDWQEVCEVLGEAGLATHPVELTRKAFENSYCKVFVFDGELLVGVGRAVADGAYEAALYDIAVLPSHQGKNLGRRIVEELHQELQGMNVILFSRPGKEEFYEKMGYCRLLTGMAKFENECAMRKGGFIR